MTHDTPASSALLSSEDWAELHALNAIKGNLTTFMGKLSPPLQKDYLRLCREQVEREANLAQALKAFYDKLEQQLVDALEEALTLKAGKPVNARTTYLKTRIRQLPVPQSELPDIAPNEPFSTRLQLYKEDLSVREYERSISLLEAAHRNFGFTAYFSTEEQNASSISDPALSVKDFVAVSRQVDIGRRISDYIEQNFSARLATPLFAVQSHKLYLALYDASRTNAVWGISAQELESLRRQVSDSTLHWNTYQIDAGGEKVALPFFTRRFQSPSGPCVYSYFPDRPEGAFRRHFSESEAVDELQQLLRNEVGLASFNWFMKVISLNNQEKIRTFIKPLRVNRDKLYWHARILYDLFASTVPNRQKLVIERFGVTSRSLLHTLPINLAWPIQSDLIRLARNTRLADSEDAKALLAYVVSETLSMLLIPVPGGVTGLSKVMLVATLGSLAVQTVEAVTALRQGRQAEMVQAVSDMFDLVVGAHLQGLAARLSTRRTRQLMRSLGYPKADSRPGLWFLQAYTQVDPATLQGAEPNSRGLIEMDGQHYIRLTVDGQDKVARVTLDNASGRYRLTHHAAPYQPYVTYDRKRGRWLLDPIDTRALDDSQLLHQMLAPTHRPLSPDSCRRVLQVAGIERQRLLDIWSGHDRPHWAFDQAVEEHYLRDELRHLQHQLKQPGTALAGIADQVVPALLADLGRFSLSIYQPDGSTLVTRHAPLPAPDERPPHAIELVQDGQGQYRTRAMASAPASLLQQSLQEYERLHPDGTLGKTGYNAYDHYLANRVHELSKALSQTLGRHMGQVYHAVLAGQSREHLAVNRKGYRFAPEAKAATPSVAATLQRRFPGLGQQAAAELARQHPSLSVGDYSPIDAAARTALLEHQRHSREIQALGALADPSGIGLNRYSEALFCNLLVLLPRWPSHVAVQMYQATYDPTGRINGRGALLDTYGNSDADTFVMLVKANGAYAGYLQDSGDVHVQAAGINSLVGATLSTLTDTQRNALGRDIFDRDGLVEDVLTQAHVHRDHLQSFLGPVRHLPLSSATLMRFRAFDMQSITRLPDADGLYNIAGRKYVSIDQVAYQVMHDRDASTADSKVWRIVNPKDPVATDSEQVYHASRSGETQAITRNAANLWVAVIPGALGGMRRADRVHDTKLFLLQRYEPIQAAFAAIGDSGARYDALLAQVKQHPEDSPLQQAALVALEVHTLKHIRLLDSYVTSLIDNKDWLVLLKAGGLYKTELLEQQRIRVDFLNKLMGIMDARVRPQIEKEISVDSCKKNLAHMNKKLKLLEDRKAIVEQIRRLSRSDTEEVELANSKVPGENQVQVTRFNVLNRLLAADPKEPPALGLNTMMAIHWVVDELPNIPESAQPVALSMALEQIAVEKPYYTAQLAHASPEHAGYLNGILSIIDFYEMKMNDKLTELHEKSLSNQDLPIYDQDIDLDFIPTQPIGSTETPQPKKMFRARRNGTYKIMVGIKETAPDGTVTVKVDDPYKVDAPQRYEKRLGEWQPIRTEVEAKATAQWISEAHEQLRQVDEHLATARANERKKQYPSTVYEFLAGKADRLNELAQKLATPEDAALRTRLSAAGERLMTQARQLLARMYKNKDVLDVLRLNYLLEHAELRVVKTVSRKPSGRGKTRSFLDVYSINDATTGDPLWEAHFHYDRLDRPALDYTTRGGHLKTLAQAALGSAFQQREEQAGRAHQAIWREAISPKVAQKLFDRVE